MKSKNLLISTLFLATSATFLALPAQARPMGECGGMESAYGGRGGEQMSERMKQHQQQMHDALKLNPEQEKAWEKYQSSFKDMKPVERPLVAGDSGLSAPERAEKMLEFSRQRQDQMSQHLAAMKTFYATLTPEQKKVFDEQHNKRSPRGQRAPANPPTAR